MASSRVASPPAPAICLGLRLGSEFASAHRSRRGARRRRRCAPRGRDDRRARVRRDGAGRSEQWPSRGPPAYDRRPGRGAGGPRRYRFPPRPRPRPTRTLPVRRRDRSRDKGAQRGRTGAVSPSCRRSWTPIAAPLGRADRKATGSLRWISVASRFISSIRDLKGKQTPKGVAANRHSGSSAMKCRAIAIAPWVSRSSCPPCGKRTNFLGSRASANSRSP